MGKPANNVEWLNIDRTMSKCGKSGCFSYRALGLDPAKTSAYRESDKGLETCKQLVQLICCILQSNKRLSHSPFGPVVGELMGSSRESIADVIMPIGPDMNWGQRDLEAKDYAWQSCRPRVRHRHRQNQHRLRPTDRLWLDLRLCHVTATSL